MEKTHWRKAFKSDYLSSADIDRSELDLTISHVRYEGCKTQKGREYFNVAHFKEPNVKPMILNVVNSKAVKKITGGSKYIEDWVNAKVTVYVDPNVRLGNDTVEGLRIKPQSKRKPVSLAPLTEDKIDDVVKFLLNGKTLADVKKGYSISPEIEAKINAKLKAKANEANI